jgi:aspartate aminotransferase
MISKKMYELGSKSSIIREIFEYGRKRKAEIGVENVYDFSLGNPNVPAPQAVKDAMIALLEEEAPTALHSYTSAPGNPEVRATIAESINRRFDMNIEGKNIYMTTGAAASISICFKALANEGDEFITFAPFFPEYTCFVEAAGGKLLVVPANIEDFQINFDEFDKLINEKTKAIIVNSPNNPSGAVYSEDTIKKLAARLEEKSLAYGHPIFLISDEPYREIVYDDITVPYLPKYYNNTFVCYSYSKSLSLPGDRIGYIVVPNEMIEFPKIFAAIAGSARALSYVCAPSFFQKVVAKCVEETADISIYENNRNVLYNALKEIGYECVKPEGAFYLFPRSLEADAYAFCEKAKKYDLLLVPGDDFGCPGHIRISYCVKPEQIERSLPAFKKLFDEYQ